MKRIMIYGDSITWGRIPGTTCRYDKNIRYTGVVSNQLGKEYEVIEEGLRARMFSGENPNFQDRDGLKQFGPIFGSHVPLDLVIIMLGTNDTNTVSRKSANEIYADFHKYLEAVHQWSTELENPAPELLFVSPPLVIEANTHGDPKFVGAEKKTRDIPAVLESITRKMNVHFMDGSIVSGGEIEGIHIDEASHIILGEAMAEKIKEIL